jgi:hypothetical protein
VKAIRDKTIAKRLSEFIQTKPAEADWKEFCANLRLNGKDGSEGSLVKAVTVNVGSPEEYKDVSKDGTGAYRKALKGHKGQFVYSTEGKLRVRPIYAFESLRKVKQELISTFGAEAIRGLFQSGCTVELTKPVTASSMPLEAGKYKLNTIRSDGRAKLSDSKGRTSLEIKLEKLFAAGFKRVGI